jgi:hypothetical protein
MHRVRRSFVCVRATVIAALAVCASTGAIAQAPTVVMSGLDNPRGMAFAPNGALYVAEAGRGGSGPCALNGAGENRCYGATGAITRLWKGTQQRVVEGRPSHAVYNHPNPILFPDGSSASGPNDISFQGTAYITLGLGGGVEFEEAFDNEFFGTLIHMPASGKWKVVADVALHEFEENPAGGPIDSNPFGVLAEPGGRLVVDAGANALLRVAANGRIKTLAVFPSVPNPLFPGVGGPTIEAVPTSVARGPDGVLYVGQLTGVPFVPGLANIFRVVPGQNPVVHCSGFKTIIDLTFGPDGSLYVVENATGGLFFPPNSGQLSRVAPDCSRTIVLGGLDRPTSVAVGADGAIYVTNHGVTAGAGEVLKIVP